MSWINEVDEEDAEGALKRMYKKIGSTRGKVSNIMKVHSLNPAAMKAHMDLYLSVMFKNSTLSREEGEMIAVVVSSANGCAYCVNHHAEALKHYWRDDERVERFSDDYTKVELSDEYAIMLDYAKKLTEQPDSMVEDDIQSLRDAGSQDDDILNIALVTAYFNFVNRIALGLGVEFYKEEVEGYEY